MTLPADPAARHAAVAERFQEVVDGVTDWDARSPVGGWTARDVVAHLVGWAPGLLGGGADVAWPQGPDPLTDPAGAFAHQTGVVQGLLEMHAEVPFTHEHIGSMPLGQAIAQYYTPDVFMHTWDLARASGQDDTIDAEWAAELNAGMRAQAEMIRASGQFGEEQPVADDARDQDKLMAFIGRDPQWAPAR